MALRASSRAVAPSRQCTCRASAQRPQPTAALLPRRAALAAGAAATLAALSGWQQPASALEGIVEPDAQRQKLQAADESFQQSDTLKKLLERSEANRAKNKRAIENKYCARQAELGIGDCGGLRLIPGMTRSGRQETPEWLQKALGVEVPKVEGQGKTIEDLLGPLE